MINKMYNDKKMYEYLGHVQGGVQDKHLLAPRATKHDHQRQHDPGVSGPRRDPPGAFKPQAPLRRTVWYTQRVLNEGFLEYARVNCIKSFRHEMWCKFTRSDSTGAFKPQAPLRRNF
jgi:hypothetical protein